MRYRMMVEFESDNLDDHIIINPERELATQIEDCFADEDIEVDVKNMDISEI